MNVIGFIICILVSSACYRVGGSDLNIPLKSKIRDWGVPACGVFAMFMLHVNAPWYIHLIYFFLAWGSLVTYWDHWGDDNVQWYEWLLTGFMYSMSTLPYAIYSGHWIAFGVHAVVLTGLFMAVRCGSKNVYVEECGSGAIYIISKLAFLIKG